MSYKSSGIALITLGIIMFMWTAFAFITKDKTATAPPVEHYANQPKAVNWPPMLGAVLIFSGIILMVTGQPAKALGSGQS